MASAGHTVIYFTMDDKPENDSVSSSHAPSERLIASTSVSPSSPPASTLPLSTLSTSSSGETLTSDEDAVLETSNPDHDYASLLEFVMAATWACVDQQHPGAKNALYTRFFTCYEDIEMIALAANISFAPGLMDIVRCVQSPSIEYFKSLPTEVADRWAVYAILMEKTEHRPRLYVGVGTGDGHGVASRLKNYECNNSLPLHVRNSLEEGYRIVHKGLLLWIPIPPVGVAPINRLMCYAFEATLAYLFWAMRCALTKDWNIGHFCLWDRATLEWDGLCSHSAFSDSVQGDFGFTPEEVEQIVADRKQRRLEYRRQRAPQIAEYNRFYYAKKKAENPVEHSAANVKRVKEWRENNRERSNAYQVARGRKAKENELHRCVDCEQSFVNKIGLEKHYKSKPHHDKIGAPYVYPYNCRYCNKGMARKDTLAQHEERHRKDAQQAGSLSHWLQ